MKIRKYEKLRLLYDGNTKLITCKYTESILKGIPIFISSDLSSIQIIESTDEEVLVIVNEDTYNTLKRYKANNSSDLTLEIFIMYSILQQKDKNVYKNDICLAYWFGFNNIINLINMGNIGEITDSRIKRLEEELVTKLYVKSVPNIKSVVDSIKFVEVEI